MSAKAKFICLLVMVGMFFMVSTTVFAEGNISVTAKPGFDGLYKLRNWTPFEITLVNNGSDFDGEVQILTNMDYDYGNQTRSMAYAASVKLSKGESKTIKISAYIFIPQKEVTLQLLQKGKVYQQEKISLTKNSYSSDTPIIGVLSEDKSDLQYISGMKLAVKGPTAYDIFRLDEKSFPENSKEFRNFDALVINNFDTSLLNIDQKSRLVEWVKSGGVLVVGTGANWQKVMSGLPKELTALSVKGEKTVNESQALADYTNKKLAPLSGQLVVVDGTIEKGNVILQGKESPLIMNYPMGRGNVITFTFDPAAPAIEDWVGNKSMWEGTLGKFITPQQAMVMNEYYGDIYFQNSIPQSEMPSVWWVIILVILYIAVVGVINYIVLKKMDKRDLMWVTVPAISLLTISIIYLVGFSTRFDSPVISKVSVLNADMQTGLLHENSYMTVFSPEKGKLKIDINTNGEITPGEYNNYSPYNSGEQVNSKDGRIVTRFTQSGSPSIEYFNLRTWDTRNFKLERNLDTGTDKKLNASLRLDGDFIKGEFTNPLDTPIKEAVLKLGGYYLELGDINKGETKEININFKNSKPTDLDSFLNEKYPMYFKGKRNASGGEENWSKRDILMRFSNELNSISSDNKEPIDAMLFGWYDDTINDNILANNKEPKVFSRNLFKCSIDFSGSTGDEVRYIPGTIYPSSTGNGIIVREKFGVDGRYAQVFNDESLEFSFNIPSNLKLKSAEILWNPELISFDESNKVGHTALFYIYNLKSSKWIKTEDKFEFTGNEASDFVSSTGVILVKAEIKLNEHEPGMGYRFMVPNIDVSGVIK